MSDRPAVLIVEGRDLVSKFQRIVPTPMSPVNLQETLVQVVSVLLNGDQGTLDAMNGLPDFKRLVGMDATLQDPDHVKLVQQATSELGFELYRRLLELGAYESGLFSYFFSHLLGNDFVFTKLPY